MHGQYISDEFGKAIDGLQYEPAQSIIYKIKHNKMMNPADYNQLVTDKNVGN